jgi:hypothetical protein
LTLRQCGQRRHRDDGQTGTKGQALHHAGTNTQSGEQTRAATESQSVELLHAGRVLLAGRHTFLRHTVHGQCHATGFGGGL